MQKRVLLVEDYLDLGELIAGVLEKKGLSVQWYVRARFAGEDIVLMDADGKETVLDPAKFDVAIMDGRIKGGDVHGWDLTPRLVKAGLPVVAASGDPWINSQMMEAGARACIFKHDIIGRALKGDLSFLN